MRPVLWGMSELTEGDQTDNIRAATRIVYESALRRIKERVFGHEHLVQRVAMAATLYHNLYHEPRIWYTLEKGAGPNPLCVGP